VEELRVADFSSDLYDLSRRFEAYDFKHAIPTGRTLNSDKRNAGEICPLPDFA
jgi:hypothetical protein